MLDSSLAMRITIRDRIVNLLIILFFLGAIVGSGYYIYRVMIHWNVKGLG